MWRSSRWARRRSVLTKPPRTNLSFLRVQRWQQAPRPPSATSKSVREGLLAIRTMNTLSMRGVTAIDSVRSSTTQLDSLKPYAGVHSQVFPHRSGHVSPYHAAAGYDRYALCSEKGSKIDCSECKPGYRHALLVGSKSDPICVRGG